MSKSSINQPKDSINPSSLLPDKTNDGYNKIILPINKHLWNDPLMENTHLSIIVQILSGASKHSIHAQMDGPRLCEIVSKLTPILTNPTNINRMVYRGKCNNGHVKTVGMIQAGNELKNNSRTPFAKGKMQITIPFDARKKSSCMMVWGMTVDAS